jgi:hypothetical protein
MERIFPDLVTTARRERDFDVEGSLTSDDPERGSRVTRACPHAPTPAICTH